MSIGSRIKERREAIGMKQEELAAILGVSKGAIGNYEADYNLPKATMINPIAQALRTDPNFLFQDGAFFGEDSFTEKEKEHIKKYRALDEHGKRIIDTILDIEYKHSATPQKSAPESPVPTNTTENSVENFKDDVEKDRLVIVLGTDGKEYEMPLKEAVRQNLLTPEQLKKYRS